MIIIIDDSNCIIIIMLVVVVLVLPSLTVVLILIITEIALSFFIFIKEYKYTINTANYNTTIIIVPPSSCFIKYLRKC